MRVYVVGGAVRDALLGLPVKDRDWVVVGSTPEAMRAQGFRPVGRDFPVFLHPHTGEEYALARTERKSGRGYTGFTCHASPEVTLEEDLLRRDLTINAIARAEDGTLIDPYGGQRDLAAGVFRHVSPAFAEDPLRILRVARFAARFTDFTVAPETLVLMRRMVAAGEVNHLVAERVWQELARGLMEARPSRMIRVLRDCGALAVILPELERLFCVPQPTRPAIDAGEQMLRVVDTAAASAQPLAVRWACLLHEQGKADPPAAGQATHGGQEASSDRAREVSRRLKAPTECRDLAEMLAREHGLLSQADRQDAETLVRLIERCDGLRRPARFELMLAAVACELASHGTPPENACAARPLTRWHAALAAVRSVDAATIARNCKDKSLIPQALHAARVAAVKTLEEGTP